MEKQKCIFFFLIVALMIVSLISFATKGAHWDKVTDKGAFESYYSDVYRSMEGLITMDVLLFVLCLPILFYYNANNEKNLKVLMILLALILFIRFILAVIFLAGNDEFCRKTIEYWDDTPQYFKDFFPSSNFYTTLKGAWVFEIIAIILVNLIGFAVLFILIKKGRQN